MRLQQLTSSFKYRPSTAVLRFQTTREWHSRGWPVTTSMARRHLSGISTAPAQVEQARRHLALKQFTNAISTLSNAIKESMATPSPAASREAASRPKPAADINVAVILLERGHCFSLVRARSEALRDFTRALEIADALRCSQDSNEETRQLAEAVSLMAHLRIGISTLVQRRPTVSLQHFETALQLCITDPSLLSQDSASAFKFDDLANYREALWPLLSSLLPESIKSAAPIESFADFVGFLLFEFAEAHLISEQFENAIVKYNAGLQIMFGRSSESASQQAYLETHKRALANLISSYMYKNDYDAALQVCSRLVALDPTSPHPYLQRASIFTETRQLEDAANEYAELIRIDPTNAAEYHVRRAQIYDMQKEESGPMAETVLRDRILHDVEKAIELGTEDPAAYAMRAHIRRKAQKWDDAQQDYLNAIERTIRPVEKAKLHVDLADMFLEMDGHELEAQEQYGKAVVLDPDNRAAHAGYSNVIQQFKINA